MTCSPHQLQSNKTTPEPTLMVPFDHRPGVPGRSDRRTGQFVGQFVPFPKKSELKMGECSAFFTYVKSNTVKNNYQSITNICQGVEIEGNAAQPARVEDKSETRHEHVNNGNIRYENRTTWENNLHVSRCAGAHNPLSMERSSTPLFR